MGSRRERGKQKPREAFSLMEVIFATAILLGSTLVLVQLVGIGREHAWKADDVTRAQVLCQNKLNELLAGIAPLEPAEDEALEEDPDWTYTVQVEPLDLAGLVSVSVAVSEVPSDSDLAGRTDQSRRGFRLVRWMRQPAMADGHEVPTAPSGTREDPGEEFR